jgi:hypothetical protein
MSLDDSVSKKQDTTKWTFEFTGPKQILEFISKYI